MVNVPLRGAGTDGRYDHMKPDDRLPSWSNARPWATKEEQLTTQAVAVALASAPEVQDTVRPPLPQVNLFPPRFGYRSTQLGINEVVDVNEIYHTPSAANFSGTVAGYQGSARNSWGSGSW
jgi:hypothetical protein